MNLSMRKSNVPSRSCGVGWFVIHHHLSKQVSTTQPPCDFRHGTHLTVPTAAIRDEHGTALDNGPKNVFVTKAMTLDEIRSDRLTDRWIDIGRWIDRDDSTGLPQGSDMSAKRGWMILIGLNAIKDH